MSFESIPRWTRRDAVKIAAGLGLLAPACGERISGGNPQAVNRSEYQRRQIRQTGAVREVRLTAAEGEVDVGGRIYRKMVVQRQVPGPPDSSQRRRKGPGEGR